MVAIPLRGMKGAHPSHDIRKDHGGYRCCDCDCGAGGSAAKLPCPVSVTDRNALHTMAAIDRLAQ
mgnify:CR=1 FL=1